MRLFFVSMLLASASIALAQNTELNFDIQTSCTILTGGQLTGIGTGNAGITCDSTTFIVTGAAAEGAPARDAPIVTTPAPQLAAPEQIAPTPAVVPQPAPAPATQAAPSLAIPVATPLPADPVEAAMVVPQVPETLPAHVVMNKDYMENAVISGPGLKGQGVISITFDDGRNRGLEYMVSGTILAGQGSHLVLYSRPNGRVGSWNIRSALEVEEVIYSDEGVEIFRLESSYVGPQYFHLRAPALPLTVWVNSP